MKFQDALKILNNPDTSKEKAPFVGFLACGFEPLHLKTFLAAQLQQRLPQHAISVQTGIFGDLLGNLERGQKINADCLGLVLEWADLDPRLGLRHLGGWRRSDLQDILKTAGALTERLQESILCIAQKLPLAVCLPTLPLPPITHATVSQSNGFDIGLREILCNFAGQISSQRGVRLVNSQWLDVNSPLPNRRDVKAELTFGFPYQLAHASFLAEALVGLMCPRPPKKGLITDLDETLWRGVLGEVGVEGISWELAKGSQTHGLYQQLLASLAEAGTLIAAASKNNLAIVKQAFERDDLVLPGDRVFPVEAHWGPKSESIGRILKTWNIAADAVVFIDDSLMELEEVKAIYPAIECIQFPGRDGQAVYELLHRLRNLFGKEEVTEEDSLRLGSIRNGQITQEYLGTSSERLDEFLKGVNAELSMSLIKHPVDARALELINKTNQFNLNGARHTESSWRTLLQGPDTFLLVVSYKDKYGPIGKIAVLCGRVSAPHQVHVQTWVMSCRAFARRIEHQCLKHLFEKFMVDKIVFDYQVTSANGPLQEFFAELFAEPAGAQCELGRAAFFEKCPALYHKVIEVLP